MATDTMVSADLASGTAPIIREYRLRGGTQPVPMTRRCRPGSNAKLAVTAAARIENLDAGSIARGFGTWTVGTRSLWPCPPTGRRG